MSPTVRVSDMTCDGCEDVVETAVGFVDGVESVDADRDAGEVRIDGDVDPEDAVEKIELAGYEAST